MIDITINYLINGKAGDKTGMHDARQNLLCAGIMGHNVFDKYWQSPLIREGFMGRSYDQIPAMPENLLDNPIGVVEEFAINQDWNSERANENELWAEMPSQWGNQRLWVAYHEETGFLQFNAYLNLKIPQRFMELAAQTITLMNERVWLGHFEIWNEERSPVFRVVLPLRGAEFRLEQLEDVVAAIEEETERFHPALQWVVWGGKTPEEAIAAAIVETEGEA